jgi:FSR family fosmidomycin resistance protein-like MFS transporter
VRLGALAVTGFALLSTTPVMLAMVQERAVRSPAAANGLFMMVAFIARSTIVVLTSQDSTSTVIFVSAMHV